MKNSTVENLLLLMVAAGWSRNSIIAVLDDIHNTSIYTLEDQLDNLIRVQENITSSANWKNQEFRRYSRPSFSASYKHSHSDSSYSDLYLKLRKMLVEELNLTTEEIVYLVATKLPEGNIPPLSKKSLANWLERLSAHYSPSEILHAATLIMDDYKKRSRLDWNIRSEE